MMRRASGVVRPSRPEGISATRGAGGGPTAASVPVIRSGPMAPTVTIRRSSRARHARLQITRQGQAVVVLPLRAPDHVADELLALRAGWLRLHQGRILEARARLAGRPPLGQRPLPLGGIPHAIEIAALADGATRTRIEHDDTEQPTIRLLLAPGDERPVGEILEPWLRREARHTIGRRVAVRAPQVGVTPARVAIRDQRSRWGSASRRGSLSFSWRL